MSTSYVLRSEDDGSGKSLINVDGRKGAKSCKAYKNDAAYTGGAAGDGVHWINPNGSWVQAYCDQTRDGGGWTMYLKHWYGDGIHGVAAASGPISVAATHKGTPYKLADTDIRALIGATNNFDALVDQSNYNTAYSNGNYEYVVIRNYTAALGFDYLVAASSTTTAMESRRASDNALAWSGNLACGSTGGVNASGRGINCFNVLSGTNPQGGAGCTINMGKTSNAGYHNIYMSEYNGDTYLYVCNGAQHSSSHDMNHRWWIRERN